MANSLCPKPKSQYSPQACSSCSFYISIDSNFIFLVPQAKNLDSFFSNIPHPICHENLLNSGFKNTCRIEILTTSTDQPVAQTTSFLLGLLTLSHNRFLSIYLPLPCSVYPKYNIQADPSLKVNTLQGLSFRSDESQHLFQWPTKPCLYGLDFASVTSQIYYYFPFTHFVCFGPTGLFAIL